MDFYEFKRLVTLLAKRPINNTNTIQKLISKYFGGIGSFYFDCPNRFFVRASRNEKNEIFQNATRCSYNPNFAKIPMQRCNYPKQPVFYCSMFTQTDYAWTSITCIMETALEDMKNHKVSKRYYTLSRWDLQRPLKLWVLPFSKLSHKRNQDFKNMSQEIKRMLKTNKNRHEILNSFTYMSEVFCKRNNKKMYYKISSAFFNYLLTERIAEDCDGLAYSSANTERAGVNVVLKRDLVDNKVIYCTAATMYSFERNLYDKKRLKTLPCSLNAFPDLKGRLHFNIFPAAQSDFL